MNKPCQHVVLLGAAALCAMAGPAAANRIANPGFEQRGGDAVPVGWGAWASVGYIFPWQDDPGNAFEGNSYTELQDASWAVAFHHNIPVTPGERIYFSAMIRKAPTSTAATASAELKFEFYGGLDKADPRGESPTYPAVTDQWQEYTHQAVVPDGANYITATLATGGAGQVNWFDSIWVEAYPRNWHQASSPQPADGAKVPVALDTLQWVNPDPNDPAQPVTCTVYFTDHYPEYGLYPGDPNFLNYAAAIVTDEAVDSVNLLELPEPIILEFGRDYFWRVDCTDPTMGATTIGRVWRFTADNTPPEVDAGADVFTWLTEGSVSVQMLPAVSDDGRPDPPGELSLTWATVPPDAANIEITGENDEQAWATMTALGSYVMQLTADDSELTASDTMTIHVLATACDAAKAAGIPLSPADLNEDCHVNVLDLAEMAADWLACTSLDCP